MTEEQKYLSRAFEINRRVTRLKGQLESLKSKTTYTGPVYGDVKIQSNMTGSAVENAALRRVHLENELKETQKELENVMAAISSTIKRVGDSNMEILLEMRYLSFMDWNKIIECMGYSRCYVFKLHSRALRKVKMLI